MCCDGWDYSNEEVNGVCSTCGEDTVDGIAQSGCHYSPNSCDDCGDAPCDGSC